MDKFVTEKDLELLSRDECTFYVLGKILRRQNTLVLTDHRDLILCYSEPPFPVWLWTSDGCSDAVKESAWLAVKEDLPFSAGYSVNMKYEAAEYFKRRAEEEGTPVAISEQMRALVCPKPVNPDIEADGALHICGPEDVAEGAAMRSLFFAEIGHEAPPFAHIEETVRGHVEAKTLFFWKNSDGETVSCCNYKTVGSLGCIGCVLTKREHRRRHYAQNMVYRVSEIIKSTGATPMLYTDANYPASNACYEKVGFKVSGEVCTVSAD